MEKEDFFWKAYAKNQDSHKIRNMLKIHNVTHFPILCDDCCLLEVLEKEGFEFPF